MESNGTRTRALFRLNVLLLAANLVFGVFLVRRVSAVPSETYEKLGVFTDVLKKVQDYYVRETNSKDLIYGAIRGMLETLDPHTSFLTPDMYTEMQVDTKGSFGGLGIEISIRDGILTVVSPIEDTPASRAGIQAGDRILEIDGTTTKDITLPEAVKRLRGPRGTKVTITVLREGFTEPRPFTMMRDVIAIQSVKGRMLEPGYGYARITQFQEPTADALSKLLKDEEKQSGGSLKGLVLDLRNNPGGLLDQAVKVSNLFVDDGLIVYTEGRDPSQRQDFRARPGEAHLGFPMVVLVNKGSASASEIVSGCLQDDGRALILGTTTFGKGSVQTIFPLEDGSGLRLTTQRYFTPSGRSIQDKGITPDIAVEPPESARSGGDEEAKPPKPPEKEGAKPKAPEDVQLDRALDYLKSWYIFKHVVQTRGSRDAAQAR